MNMYSYPSYIRTTEVRSGTIKVTGEQTLYVDPDQAIVSIGVVTKNEDLEEAQSQNRQISNKVVQSLMKNDIPKKDIQTSTYQIFPQYNYEDGKQVFTGYEVRHVFRVTVNDIDSLGKIIDDAVKSGANRVENIQFVNSDPAKTYQQALAAAYQNSYEKALTLSNQSGQQLNPYPKSITEHSGTAVIPYAPTAFVKAAEESTTLQPGQIGVTASLTAEFRTK
ncbi:SIMPL domain-containing protein [Rossellomorea sp. NS-SX7]|uniref:SIMPL domain-containing protein n=1 Tax=Rossellomorea sp. NS-SX7 TaxID=3463856 RepID=UPI004059942A